jgi:hypothetical protein
MTVTDDLRKHRTMLLTTFRKDDSGEVSFDEDEARS